MNVTEERKKQANELITLLGKELDVPESKYEDAESRYKSVGAWLNRDNSSIKRFTPDIYVQGSFLLGTAISPISEDGEYDLDAVCNLALRTDQVTQEQLKAMVGEEVQAYAKKETMKKTPCEGRRCWTLHYSDSSRFHMDILPSIPNEKGFRLLLEKRGTSSEFTEDAISITDNERSDYSLITDEWFISNPKGYAKWFREKMKTVSQINFSRSEVLMEKYASVEDVPTFKLRTPLQRAIQILKRHRDIHHGDDEDKPISIIITTLAARSYNNSTDLYEALTDIVFGMEGQIENRGGVSWVPNPVNPTENFADRWEKYPQREVKFRAWLNDLKEGLSFLIQESSGLHNFSAGMTKIAGDDVAKRVMENYASSMRSARDAGTLKATAGSVSLGIGSSASGSTVKKHNFYGV